MSDEYTENMDAARSELRYFLIESNIFEEDVFLVLVNAGYDSIQALIECVDEDVIRDELAGLNTACKRKLTAAILKQLNLYGKLPSKFFQEAHALSVLDDKLLGKTINDASTINLRSLKDDKDEDDQNGDDLQVSVELPSVKTQAKDEGTYGPINVSMPQLKNELRDGNTSFFSKWLENGNDANLYPNNEPYALIHLAAYHNRAEIADVLIKHKADVNLLTKTNGRTPLMLAILQNKLEAIDYFITSNASLKIKDANGWNALHCAVYLKNGNDVVRKILDACDNGRATIQELMNKTNSGSTPLHICCQNGDVKTMKMIFEKAKLVMGPSIVNIQSSVGYTPLMSATFHNNYEIFKYLLSEGSDLNTTTNYGTGIMQMTVSTTKFDPTILDYLLYKLNFNINLKSSRGFTLLQDAVLKKNVPAVICLLNRKAHINAQSDKLHTALSLAISNKSEEIVNILLDNYADTHAHGIKNYKLSEEAKKKKMSDQTVKRLQKLE